MREVMEGGGDPTVEGCAGNGSCWGFADVGVGVGIDAGVGVGVVLELLLVLVLVLDLVVLDDGGLLLTLLPVAVAVAVDVVVDCYHSSTLMLVGGDIGAVGGWCAGGGSVTWSSSWVTAFVVGVNELSFPLITRF